MLQKVECSHSNVKAELWLTPVLGSVYTYVGAAADRMVTNDTRRGVRLYAWAEDSKHILYLQVSWNKQLHVVFYANMPLSWIPHVQYPAAKFSSSEGCCFWVGDVPPGSIPLTTEL